MKKIIFYNLQGQKKKEEILAKENLEHINGMMSKCTMIDKTEEVGFADPTGFYDREKYNGKVNDYIFLWTWDNLDENTGSLKGTNDEKFKQTFKPIKIADIEMIEAILCSNPRWGGKLTNKFEFYTNDTDQFEVKIPDFLSNKKNKKE